MTRKHKIATAVARRGANSFYVEASAATDEKSSFEKRICFGTSCVLARESSHQCAEQTSHIANAKPGAEPLQPAYCLGYCDRSPVALDQNELLFSTAGASGLQRISLGSDALHPSLRCRAPEAIVTHGLTIGGTPDLASARKAGAYTQLEKALSLGAEHLLEEIEASQLCGRGGAGFSTGRKWRSAAAAGDAEKYVVANGDEGDPGSFVDRVLMEDVPHHVLEGLALCGLAVGARQGIVYIRAEYPFAATRMRKAVAEARSAGILGASVLGSKFAFDISIHIGRGSYVCGEETALLHSIEGQRGEVQIRPPYPTQEGLWGKPTVVNNIETLLNVAWILQHGSKAFRAIGSAHSKGTKVLCLNSGFATPGLVEVAFGDSLREIIEEASGGADLAAVLLGGPMGSILFPEEWDISICYTEMSRRGIELGHGGLIAVPRDVDWRALVLHGLEFMADESCGRCTPCRLGSQQSLDWLRRPADASTRENLLRLFAVMEKGSLCAFGRNIPRPLRRMIERHADQIFVSRETV